MSSLASILFLIVCTITEVLTLYPKESETRDARVLNGIWNFRTIPLEDDQNIGFTHKWYSQSLESVSHKFYPFKEFNYY